MSLIEEQWMPVRLRSGERTYISPLDLYRPDLAAFDANRPDFNGALAQFAIGLLQTSTRVDSPSEWRALFKSPPDAATLREWFRPLADAFELDGDGARFMQDLDLRESDGDAVGIAGLLIESPGENTLKNNADHFVKRGQVKQLCRPCAALALFTLQVNAPSGGAGHRTGVRGGGPLTTLLVAPSTSGMQRCLWRDLWLNVQERRYFLGNGGDETKVALHFTFPWLAGITVLQKTGGEIAPIQVHPAHVFWAMPRRIRLDFDGTAPGVCDLCGRESGTLVRRYITRNYGLNYKGPWKHPLSPYYQAKEGQLPLHPQPGGIGYRHWLGWVLGQSDQRGIEAAAVVQNFLSMERKVGAELRLWAFGFDMANMKARCWYEATLPLYALGECSAESLRALREDVGNWLAGAEVASSLLRGAVKDAWFGRDARGDLSFVDASFWSRTEDAFYSFLRERIDAARNEQEWDRLGAAEGWRTELRAAALGLFDGQFVASASVDRQDPARVAKAYQKLSRDLNGAKMHAALGLPRPKKGELEVARQAATRA